MTWIERMLEERLARAAADGELDTPHLRGTALPDLDRPREPGWWADRFVARERSHDRRVVAETAAAAARAGFWRAGSAVELRTAVAAANAAIARANAHLIDADRLSLFDVGEIEDRWRELRRA